jgi:hypothetical protein
MSTRRPRASFWGRSMGWPQANKAAPDLPRYQRGWDARWDARRPAGWTQALAGGRPSRSSSPR